MRPRDGRRHIRHRWFWFAGSLWTLSILLTVGVAVVDALNRDPGESAVLVTLVSLAAALGLLAFTTVGGLVGWLRPHNPVGWLLLAVGLVGIVGSAVESYVKAPGAPRPGTAGAAAVLDSAIWVAFLGLIALVLLAYPTGRSPTRRWRFIRWLVMGGGAILSTSLFVTPGQLGSFPDIGNPFGVEGLADVAKVLSGVARVGFFIGFNGAMVSVVVRYRRSSGLERQQLRWLVLGVALMTTGFLIGGVLTTLGLPGEPLFNVFPLFIVPVAVGIAILRYRLWDLDLVVSRTLTYGLLAVTITGIYTLMVAGFGALIGGGTSSDVWLAVLATAIAAALFQPAREAAHSGVRRMLFRTSGDATGQPAVSIRTLGGFRVERSGEPVGASGWQSKKARQLLKMLVARRGRSVHREQLIDALWPDEINGKLANRLAVAASTLRSVLDPEKDHASDHFVMGDADTLRLDLDHVAVDVERFLSTAEMGLSSAGGELEVAEAMYRGDFLEEDLYEEWAQSLREEARAMYLTVLRALADIEQDRGIDSGVAALLKILEVDPWDEPAHLAVVSALTAAGRHGEAQRAYRRYRNRMEEVGVPPAPI